MTINQLEKITAGKRRFDSQLEDFADRLIRALDNKQKGELQCDSSSQQTGKS